MYVVWGLQALDMLLV